MTTNSAAAACQLEPQQSYFVPTQPAEEDAASKTILTVVAGHKSRHVKTVIESDGTEPQPSNSNAFERIAGKSYDFEFASKAIERIDNVQLKSARFAPSGRFIVTQKWEGHVVAQNDGVVKAIISDLTCPNNPPEEIEFDIEEVSEADMGLVKIGAIFYWHIGYYDDINGQRSRSSSFRFRRLPAWSRLEIAQAKKEADELFNIISQG